MASEVQFSTACAPIFSSREGKVAEASDLQPAKADSPISFTDSGNVMVVRLTFFAKRSLAMLVMLIPSANVMLCSPSHSLKAAVPS